MEKNLTTKQEMVLDPDRESRPEEVASSDADASNESETEISWLTVVRAAQDKKATDILVLDLRGVTTFTDIFVICTAANSKQMQAITDEAAISMKRIGEPVQSTEGYEGGEWVLSDYSDILLHVFNEKSREFYSLERLWKEAKRLEIPPPEVPALPE